MSKQRYNEIFNAFINYIKENRLHVGTMQNVNKHWNSFTLFEYDMTQDEEITFVKVFGNNINKIQRAIK